MLAFIFDTETSGLSYNRTIKTDKQPHLVEFYGCLVNLATGEIMHEYEALIKPPKPLDKAIQFITKITDEMLTNCPVFADVADVIIGTLEAAPLVIAHNASFDKEIVDIEAARLGRVIKWPRALCTVEQTVHLKGKRMTLTALHEFLFGEKFDDAHRAKIDTQALVRCCIELHKREVI